MRMNPTQVPTRSAHEAWSYLTATCSGNPSHRALVAVTDPGWAASLALDLHSAGLIPTLAFTAPQLLHCLDVDTWDVVLVGLGLDHSRGVPFLRTVRGRSDAVILILSDNASPAPLGMVGRQEEVPCSTPTADVAARAAALVGLVPPTARSAVVEWGAVRLDVARRRAYVRSEPVDLTPLQFRILLALVNAQGCVLTLAELSRLVWGTTALDGTERVFAHIRRLRQRVEPDPARPRVVLTVRGEGFRIADE